MYIYINIYMHTEAHPSIPSHLYTHVYTSIHTCTHEQMAADKADGAADACVRAHLGIRTCLDAQASIQTHICTNGHSTPSRARRHARRGLGAAATGNIAAAAAASTPRGAAQRPAPYRARTRVCHSRRARSHAFYAHAHTLTGTLYINAYMYT